MWSVRLKAVQSSDIKNSECFLKYLSVQHLNKSAVLWKQPIKLYQNTPALLSQIMVTWMTLILVFPNFLVLSNGPFVFF